MYFFPNHQCHSSHSAKQYHIHYTDQLRKQHWNSHSKCFRWHRRLCLPVESNKSKHFHCHRTWSWKLYIHDYRFQRLYANLDSQYFKFGIANSYCIFTNRCLMQRSLHRFSHDDCLRRNPALYILLEYRANYFHRHRAFGRQSCNNRNRWIRLQPAAGGQYCRASCHNINCEFYEFYVQQ